MRDWVHALEARLGKRVGGHAIWVSLTCALVAIATPTYAVTLTMLGGHPNHLGWVALTPVFAVLAKLFAAVDWLVVHRFRRVLLTIALLSAGALEIVYLGHLIGVHLAL